MLIATDDDDDIAYSAIASSARDSEELYVPVVDMPELGADAIKDDNHIFHVAGGIIHETCSNLETTKILLQFRLSWMDCKTLLWLLVGIQWIPRFPP